MKTFKIVFLTLVLAIGFAFPSCEFNGNPCYCPEYFEITGMEVNFEKFQNQFIPVSNTRVIGKDETLFLSFRPTYKFYSFDCFESFSLINSALACDCVGANWEGIKSKDSLVNISLTTVYNFDDNYQAGDDISDLFYDSTKKVSLKEIYENEQFNYGAYFLLHGRLKLMQRPIRDKEFAVKLSIELSTGETYEATSPTVIFPYPFQK